MSRWVALTRCPFDGETLLHLFRDEDGAMLAAGAAEGYGEIALALVDVVREQELEHVRCFVEELLCLGELTNILRDLGVAAGELAELGDEVRVGEEAHVEDEVRVCRDAVLEAEAGGGDGEAPGASFALELRVDVGAEFMNIEAGGVQDDVGDVADGVEALAFSAYAV